MAGDTYRDENNKPYFNLCKTPELICNTDKFPELKWVAGFNYWLESVQTSQKDDSLDWKGFKAMLEAADNSVKGDQSKTDPTSDFKAFVDGCSGLVNRGCPSSKNCPSGAVDHADFRLACSHKVLGILNDNPKVDNIDKVFKDPANDWKQFVLANDSTFAAEISSKGWIAGFTALDPTSSIYTYKDFIVALGIVSKQGIAGKTFMLTKANIAAFLGQCMAETILYNACDENNWTEQSARRMVDGLCHDASDCSQPKVCTESNGEWYKIFIQKIYILLALLVRNRQIIHLLHLVVSLDNYIQNILVTKVVKKMMSKI